MKIELKEIPVSAVFAGYQDSAEEGVVGFGGRLNIRPAFQREFIYKDHQRDDVIRTIRKNFPLNVMYWVMNDAGNYELLDGQQRTISFCQYIKGDYSIDYQYFHNLEQDEKQQIMDYKLMIYICQGTPKEKLDWFRIINIAGERLLEQELLNAMHTGEWLTDAKRYFSKIGCPASKVAEDYLKGSAIRQDYLASALQWIAARDNTTTQAYMGKHQHDTNANELWLYFQSVVAWVAATFPQTRKEMKGVEWGILYNTYASRRYDPRALEQRIIALLEDDDVTKPSGIYEYLLGGDEKHLSIRQFSAKIKRSVYERQQGICTHCQKHFELHEMEADHITPWHLGGKTVTENCQLLCLDCNRRKSGK